MLAGALSLPGLRGNQPDDVTAWRGRSNRSNMTRAICKSSCKGCIVQRKRKVTSKKRLLAEDQLETITACLSKGSTKTLLISDCQAMIGPCQEEGVKLCCRTFAYFRTSEIAKAPAAVDPAEDCASHSQHLAARFPDASPRPMFAAAAPACPAAQQLTSPSRTTAVLCCANVLSRAGSVA